MYAVLRNVPFRYKMYLFGYINEENLNNSSLFTSSQTSAKRLWSVCDSADVWKDKPLVNVPIFKIGHVSRGPKSFAKLRSLAPLLDLSFDAGFSWPSKDIVSNLYRILRLRRSALSRLSNDGWDRAKHEWERLFGCPPTGAWVLPTARECRVDYFCPFCWVRHVTCELYDRLAWALYNTTQLQMGPHLKRFVDLIWLQKQTVIDLADYAKPSHLFEAVRDTARTLCTERLAGKTLGGYSLASLQPTLDLTSKDVLLTEAILVVGLPRLKVSKLCEEYGFIEQRLPAADICPMAIAELVGMFCEYPSGLIFGSTEVTHSILKVRRRPRQNLRPPSMSQYWGYLQQFPIFKFDVKCHLAYQEECTDATKPNTIAALRGISP